MLNGYTITEDGVIKQDGFFDTPKVYDVQYVKERYDTYGDKNEKMSALRWDNIVNVLGRKPYMLFDIGYGNGSFLKYAQNFCPTWGHDVSGYPLPAGCRPAHDVTFGVYDVACMFDVLEHFVDPTIIKDINTSYLVVSAPWCHHDKYGDEWFKNWKHRRPDEHLWHFSDKSIIKFAKRCGYDIVDVSNVEDEIRTPEGKDPNILTVILKKHHVN